MPIVVSKRLNNQEVWKMNIRAADIIGAGNNDAAVAAAVVAKTGEGSQYAQSSRKSGGNGDPSPEQVKEIVSDMQGQLDSMNVSLQYSLYGQNGRNVAIKVVDKATGDVIREIPPKEMQALQEKMSELVGMIFNKSV
jgi:flagellar protein FlaG